MMLKCACHEEPFEDGDRAWLQEDGETVLCDDGHDDDLREDPCDLREHGSPYDAAHLERILRGVSLPKGHPLRLVLLYGSGPPTRLVERWMADAGFEAARARITTPNHDERTPA